MPKWTDERVERLKKRWAEGASAGVIAAELGGWNSKDGGRSAVCAEVRRLKLPDRELKERRPRSDGARSSNISISPGSRQRRFRKEQLKAAQAQEGETEDPFAGPEVKPDLTNYERRFGKSTHLSSLERRERNLLHLDPDLNKGGAFRDVDPDIAATFVKIYEDLSKSAA